MDSPIPDRAMFEYPGYTQDGPGLGWHFGYFSFGDIAEKQIANDPNLFFSYFIKTYAGKKEIFTPELLAELIEPYSTRDKLKAFWLFTVRMLTQFVKMKHYLLRVKS